MNRKIILINTNYNVNYIVISIYYTGRPFRVSTFTYKPYTIVNPVIKGKPYKIARGGNFVVNNATKGAPENSLALLDGTEARPFHLYCLKYNCTVELLDCKIILV